MKRRSTKSARRNSAALQILRRSATLWLISAFTWACCSDDGGSHSNDFDSDDGSGHHLGDGSSNGDGNGHHLGDGNGSGDGSQVGARPTVKQVWLAQTHVQPLGGQPALQFAEDALNAHLGRTGLPMLKLVGGRDVLLKVDVVSTRQEAAPLLQARVLNGSGVELWTATLVGPGVLPASLPSGPGEVSHDLAKSFAALIPGEYIQAGLEIALTFTTAAESWSEVYPVVVGAPTVLPLTMFDFDYFGTRGSRVLSNAVLDEVGLKLPVREFRVQRVDTFISAATFFPQSQVVDGVSYSTPYIRASSFEDWAQQAEAITGVAWEAKNGRGVDHSQVLIRAMLYAGAQHYIVSMHGNFNDGTSGNFKGRGNSQMFSSSTSADVLNARNLFVHELSHNFDLYHWHEQTNGAYPYKGAMFGVGAEGANETHCGPVWRYRPAAFGDSAMGAFVTPYLEAAAGGLRYRRVISTSGSRDDRAVEVNELVGTYSDWDVRVAQEWFESKIRVWNEDFGYWATWDSVTASYSKEVREVVGLDLPLDAEPVSVFSVIVAVSSITPQANLVYGPVGPYSSGLIRRFDPRVGEDVAAAAGLVGYCPPGGCDYSVKVTQGGVERVYMLQASDTEGDVAPTDDSALTHTAINLPALDGAIEQVELLHTPDAQSLGMQGSPTSLYTWTP